MSRNGSGIYNLPTGNPVVTGTTITSNWANTTLSDLATAMTGSIAADGQTPITGNLQMGGNKITGMANGTALTDAATVGQAVPSGAILMWSGSIASVPAGWYLCDGTNGTPDLRNRFIVGAGSTYAVNATGGSADAIVVAHTHTYSGTTSTVDINHTHSGTTGGQSADHTHSSGSNGAPNGGGAGAAFTNGMGNFPGQTTTGTSNDHSHSFTSGGMNSNNTHSHTFSGTSASTGASGTNANLPPYLALAYIMKA